VLKNKVYSEHIYFVGLLICVIGLPLSNFLMSVSQFVILGGWLLSGNLKEKVKSFIKNKPAVICSSVFLLHLIWLINTENFKYAFHDINIKLPLLLLPLIIATGPQIASKQFRILLYVFIGSVLISTLAGYAAFLGLTSKQITDKRDISLFISHIRLSLNIVFAIGILIWLFIKNLKFSRGASIIYLTVSIWFIYFLTILESVTGLLLLPIIFCVLFIYYYKRISLVIKVITISAFGFIILSGSLFIYKSVNDFNKVNQVKLDSLDTYTASGNAYIHYKYDKRIENGNYVGLYICRKELESAWNARSFIPMDLTDNKNQEIYYTIQRYLSSKGYRKDAEGVAKLSDEEIREIESGETNCENKNLSAIQLRLNQIIWEFDNYKRIKNPNGHSVMMRAEFWQAAVFIINENFFTGVGTGDVNEEFLKKYEKIKSPLSERWRLRAHNQYLTFFITFGIFGFFWFLLCLIYPLTIKPITYFYLLFIVIATVSMITEDTLESQAGVTFFAFFNSLFLFQKIKPIQVTKDKGPDTE